MNIFFKSIIFCLFCGLMACNSSTVEKPAKTANAPTTTPKPKVEQKATKTPTQQATTKKKPLLSDQGISVSINTSNTKSGAETCVDVTVKQFSEVVSMQYSFNWNPKTLKYKSVKGFNLKDLSKNNFGSKKIDDGKLTFSWYDQAIQGVSVPDNTTIHQICFDAIGKKGAKSKIQITEDPIIVEITGKGGKFLKLFSETAYLKIK